MTEKEMLVRYKDSRTHIYTALVEEKATKNQLPDKFVHTLFGGSASGMVLQALDKFDTSEFESFTILKNATSISIYGAKGKNGVILIQTKSSIRKKKSKKDKIIAEFNS